MLADDRFTLCIARGQIWNVWLRQPGSLMLATDSHVHRYGGVKSESRSQAYPGVSTHEIEASTVKTASV